MTSPHNCLFLTIRYGATCEHCLVSHYNHASCNHAIYETTTACLLIPIQTLLQRRGSSKHDAGQQTLACMRSASIIKDSMAKCMSSVDAGCTILLCAQCSGNLQECMCSLSPAEHAVCRQVQHLPAVKKRVRWCAEMVTSGVNQVLPSKTQAFACIPWLHLLLCLQLCITVKACLAASLADQQGTRNLINSACL